MSCCRNNPGHPYFDTCENNTVYGLALQGKPLGPAYNQMLSQARVNEAKFEAEGAFRRSLPLCRVDQLGPGGPGCCSRSTFFPVTTSSSC